MHAQKQWLAQMWDATPVAGVSYLVFLVSQAIRSTIFRSQAPLHFCTPPNYVPPS